MEVYLDTGRLATMLRIKQGNRGLREIADEIGNSYISAATLSRIRNGSTPDMVTFVVLCNWLQASPADFFVNKPKSKQLNTVEEIASILYADKNLDQAIAHTLVLLIRAAYRDFCKLND